MFLKQLKQTGISDLPTKILREPDFKSKIVFNGKKNNAFWSMSYENTNQKTIKMHERFSKLVFLGIRENVL